MKQLTDMAHVVLRLNGVNEDHDHQRGSRTIVVRQDRLMPITYVERRYHDVIEITARMMPHGQERIWVANKALTHHVEDLHPDSVLYTYRELRREIMGLNQ